MTTIELAWKYSKCRFANIIAMLTIAICVFVQVVVMAVLDGMLVDYKNRINNLGEQLRVDLPYAGNNEKVYRLLADKIIANKKVKAVTPVLQNYAMLNYYYGYQPIILRGIDIKKELKFGNIKKYLLDINSNELSTLQNKQSADSTPIIIVGARIAEMLGITAEDIGTQKTFCHIEFAQQGTDKMVRRKFKIISRFRSSIGFYDEYLAYIPLSIAQDMFKINKQKPVNLISVWVKDSKINGKELAGIKLAITKESSAITDKLGIEPVRVKTSEDMWSSFFEGMAHENALMEIVMAFISFACGFAIFAIMYTLVADRIRDIGILRSIGYSRGRVIILFTLSGLILGVIGALVGSVGGVLFAPHVSKVYEFIVGHPLYPPRLFGAKELYIYINYDFVIIRTLLAILVAIIASLPAALWAGYKEPLEALRNE